MTSPQPPAAELAHLQHQLVALRPKMLKRLQARVGSQELAEDLLQQALIKALEQLPQLRQPDKLESWFSTLLKRVLLNHLRQRQALPVAELPEPGPVAVSEAASCACVLKLLHQLAPVDVQLLEQAVMAEQPVQQVAQQLGISPNLASVRLYRARQRLRRLLAQTCGTRSLQACQDCGC